MINVVEIESPSDGVKYFLGKEIICSYRNLDHLKIRDEHESEDALKAYIKNYVLPLNANTLTTNIRQGNFSKVLEHHSLLVFLKNGLLRLKDALEIYRKVRKIGLSIIFIIT